MKHATIVRRWLHLTRRWLYLSHRWLGIFMCLLVAMWFFSGVVMMYVGFPSLTRAERLAALPELEQDKLRFGPAELMRRLDPAQTIEELRLTSVLGRPAWLMRAGMARTMACLPTPAI